MATQQEIAEHLDITDRQVRSLLESGILSGSRGRGGLDYDECRIAYIRYLRNRADGRVKAEVPADEEGDSPGSFSLEREYAKERLRLTSAQADAQELKNEITRKRSVPVDFATFALSKLASEIASILDTLPLTLKRKHPDLEVRHLDSIQRELARARNRAAGLDELLPGFIDEYLADATD
jgi:phage terminase Nu1 subunit (DNA packaging protein)